MTGASRIIAFGTTKAEDAVGDEFLLTEEIASEPHEAAVDVEAVGHEDVPSAYAGRHWIAPVAAGLLLATWTAFFAWSNGERLLASPDPAIWAQAISQWAMPVLVIAVGWLIVMRSSSREASRFGDAAHALAAQSRQLEARLMTVNSELSLAREFISAQSRDLEALGRVATERLSRHAERLHSLIQENSARLDAIGQVSETALGNMEKLRSQLPVIASSTKDLTNNIGTAGRTASAQLEQLVRAFERVNDFGKASTAQVEALTASVAQSHDEALRQNALLEEAVASRFARLLAQAEELRGTLSAREDEALESLRTRIASLHDDGAALRQALDESQRQASEHWHATIAELGAQVSELDASIASRQDSHRAYVNEIARAGEETTARFAELEQRIAAIAAATKGSSETASSSAATLVDRLEASHEAITSISGDVAGLTDASVRLLEIIHAVAQHSRDELPGAISAGEDVLTDVERRLCALGAVMATTHDQGHEVDALITATQERLARIAQDLADTHGRVAQAGEAHGATLEALQERLSGIEATGQKVAAQASDALATAIDQLAGSAQRAVAGLSEDSAPAIAGLAARLSAETSAAIDKAMRQSADETAGKLEQAAAHAAGVAREAASQLRDQLAKVNELAGNLERRVAIARERAEENVDNDFARRAALITESLNSHAIDIAKALSSDLSDAAWSAYLRGDRGVFTRRAVRLIDAGEERAIATVYETDREFRDHVNRYIHDFEAILRQVLSARDGHALGVTLLSSDMGKLYVAVAQGIDRLRT